MAACKYGWVYSNSYPKTSERVIHLLTFTFNFTIFGLRFKTKARTILKPQPVYEGTLINTLTLTSGTFLYTASQSIVMPFPCLLLAVWHLVVVILVSAVQQKRQKIFKNVVFVMRMMTWRDYPAILHIYSVWRVLLKTLNRLKLFSVLYASKRDGWPLPLAFVFRYTIFEFFNNIFCGTRELIIDALYPG